MLGRFNIHDCLPTFSLLIAVAFQLFASQQTCYSQSQMQLAPGQFLEGQFVTADNSADGPYANQILWQSPYFDSPLRVTWNNIRSISVPEVVLDSAAKSKIIFKDGQTIVGDINRSKDGTANIVNSFLGTVQTASSEILSVEGSESAGAVTMQPADLKHLFELFPKRKGWKSSGNSIVSEGLNSVLRGALPFPKKWKLDLEISWEQTPVFEMQLVAPSKENNMMLIPRLETWNGKLVLNRESDDSVETAPLYELRPQDSGMKLSIFGNQESGQIVVYSSTGNLLGKFDRLDPKVIARMESGTFIQITNFGPPLRIDSMRIAEWNGEVDASVENAKPKFAQSLPTAPVQILLQDGSLLLGDSFQYAKNRILLSNSDSPSRTLSVPVDSIKTMRSGMPLAKPTEDDTKAFQAKMGKYGAWGLLKVKETALLGWIVPTDSSSVESAFRFLPVIGENEIGIRRDANGVLLLSDKNKPKTPFEAMNTELGAKALQAVPLRAIRPALIAPAVRIVRPANAAEQGSDEDSKSSYRLARGLQLRSGDIVDVIVEKIDNSGIYFKSKTMGTTFLPSSEVQSVQLRSRLRGVKIDQKKMERLLTVPRMRRDRPPTHLIVTVDGDFIRGNLQHLDDKELVIEEGLNRVAIARKAVSVVVWLHDRTWKSPLKNTDNQDSSNIEAKVNGEPVVVPGETSEKAFKFYLKLRPTGRATLMPTQISREFVLGSNGLLGEMKIPFTSIDRIAFGTDATFESLGDQPSPWKLSLAKLPSVFEEAASGEGGKSSSAMGTGSEMVGKPAPNFKLKQLNGTDWELHSKKGKILVLDFWASWCGPCLQAMPVVDGMIADEFSENCVWVGVNIQENKERIETTIERLKIKGLVVMDQDGGVSSEYGAEAIPMVVVIDAAGVVRHVFVGSGDEELDNLKEAIRQLTTEKPKGAN